MKQFIVITETEGEDHYLYFVEHPKKPNKEELKRFLEKNAIEIDEYGRVCENVINVEEIKDFHRIP